MKIYCDYCGTQINTDIHKNCPNCGGSYSGDEELIAAQSRQNRLDDLEVENKRLDTERKRLQNEQVKQDMQSKKSGDRSVNIMRYTILVFMLGLMLYFFIKVGVPLLNRFESSVSESNKASAETIIYLKETDQ